MICLEEFTGRVVQDFGHQPLQKKFEVRFYVCVDVEMLVKHSLKKLMERDLVSFYQGGCRSCRTC